MGRHLMREERVRVRVRGLVHNPFKSTYLYFDGLCNMVHLALQVTKAGKSQYDGCVLGHQVNVWARYIHSQDLHTMPLFPLKTPFKI